MALSQEELERYSRHIILKGVGLSGQKKLLQGKVLVIGAGWLGSPGADVSGGLRCGYIGDHG